MSSSTSTAVPNVEQLPVPLKFEYSCEENCFETVSRIDINEEIINNGSLPDCLFQEAEVDVHEKQDWINRDVDALRDLVLSETGLNSRIDRPFLLAFLRARKFDYEKAMNMIKKYYKSQVVNKDVYQNLLPSHLQSVYDKNMQTVLSQPDFMGRTILLFFTDAWKPNVTSLEDILRSQILILEHIVRLPITQLKGVRAIVDCKGLSRSQIYCLTPSYIKKMVAIIQEVFPLRFKALHFVREPAIFEWAFSLVRPFLSDTIKGRLHFHGENISELGEHVPIDILPKELGGKAGPTNNSNIVDALIHQEDYFKEHFSYGYSGNAIEDLDEKPASTNVGSIVGGFYRRMCIE